MDVVDLEPIPSPGVGVGVGELLWQTSEDKMIKNCL